MFKNFFLSKNTQYPFSLFGFQHNILLLITLFSFILIYIFKKKLSNLNEKKFKKIRIIMMLIILFNMLIYRLSYMYYGVYDVKIHLSLYYCHIVNYIFVFVLLINKKIFYKPIYIFAYIGGIWGIFFPSITEGFDCFIFYTIFISHNLLIIFVTVVMCVQEIKLIFFKDIKYFMYAVLIVIFTYFINYDFGTNFNEPNWFLFNFLIYKNLKRLALFVIGFLGYIISFIINKVYMSKIK